MTGAELPPPYHPQPPPPYHPHIGELKLPTWNPRALVLGAVFPTMRGPIPPSSRDTRKTSREKKKRKLKFVEDYLLHGQEACINRSYTLHGLTMSYGQHSPSYEQQEHFPSFEDRARASSRNVSRSGRISPSHSAHASLIRTSLVRISTEKKAKKVRFYRNGDRFYKGIVYAVSPERFRTFESLLAELTDSPLGDKTVLPNGVRYVFSLDGMRKVFSLDELREGESYVCASTKMFQKIDYPRSATPNWNVNSRTAESREREGSPLTLRPDTTSGMDYEDREYIKPKLITVVGNGTKPRKAVRILLNKKTAHSYEQVLNDVTDAIKLDSGAVRKMYTVNGRPVSCLQDFFGDESVFVAYGQEKYALDDFDLDHNEIKFVSAYRSVRQRERITLRSPKAPRRLLMSTPTANGHGGESPRQPFLAGTAPPRNNSLPSPKLGRRSPAFTRPKSPKSPGPQKLTNGNLTNGHGEHKPSAEPAELISRYKIGKTIGEGNFATVKECIDKNRQLKFALKVINKSKCRGKEDMIDNEVSILRRVKHQNIVQLIEDYENEDYLYLVMEMVTGGDLFDAISSATKYTERDASGMLYSLVCAIKYLHSLSIVHRDIKPENLLVFAHEDGSMSLKLGDFGLATVVSTPLKTVCGTPAYVAPEVIAETGYGLAIDVWSAGVITYILLSGFPPFVSATNKQEELFDKIIAGKYEFTSPFWDNISDSAKDLISGMLRVDKTDRLTAAAVVDHPWVSDDVANDTDMHSAVQSHITANFTQRPKNFSKNNGVNVIAVTALDKDSRYFQGRGHGPITPPDFTATDHDDEVF